MSEHLISNYSFSHGDLRIGDRKNGISAFMRIRNGADFLEPTIRSHINHFDEIVAVYNQCSDATPDILGRLAQEYGPKLRIFHYTDRVFPPGSEDHARTKPDSSHSLVNYSNFALARTRYRTVTKLDDDHFARNSELSNVVHTIKKNGIKNGLMMGFSGINLILDKNQALCCPLADPISGSGDIGFFNVTQDTVFTFNSKFENAPGRNLNRQFCGFLYWHLKYLKSGQGFSNYELETNKHSRFIRKKKQITENANPIKVSDLAKNLRPSITDKVMALVLPKKKFLVARNSGLESISQSTIKKELTKIGTLLEHAK